MKSWRFAGILALAGVIFVLLSTSRYGAAISFDSTHYLAVARNLPVLREYRTWDGSLYTAWPPLYPTVLAFFGVLGLDPEQAARFLNIVAFGFITLAGSLLMRRIVKSDFLFVPGSLAILFSKPLLEISNMALSDALFTAFVMLFFLCVQQESKNNLRTSLILSLIVGLACIQRYIGITLVVPLAFWTFSMFEKRKIAHRILYSAFFCLISFIPLLLWLYRNHLLVGGTGGTQAAIPKTVGSAAFLVLDAITSWFLPHGLNFTWRVAGCIIASLLLIALAFRNRLSTEDTENTERTFLSVNSRSSVSSVLKKDRMLMLLLSFSVSYLLFLIIVATRQQLDAVFYRFCAPLYPLVLCSLFHLIERASQNRHRKVISLLLIIWLAYPISWSIKNILTWKMQGSGGYSHESWQERGITKWIRSNQIEGAVYCNLPDAFYALFEKPANDFPARGTDLTQFRNEAFSTPAVLVWFKGADRTSIYDLQDLRGMVPMNRVMAFEDGEILTIEPAAKANSSGP